MGRLFLYLLHPIRHTLPQPVLEFAQVCRPLQTGIAFTNRFILPLPELVLSQTPSLYSGEIPLVIFLVDIQRVLAVIVFQFVQIRFLSRQLLAGAVFPLWDAVTVRSVI